MRVLYLFTTFPKASEKFLQRELSAMADQENLDVTIHSLFGGQGIHFKRFPVVHFDRIDTLRFPIRLIAEVWRAPTVYFQLLKLYLQSPPRSFINLLENLIGLIYGTTYAKRMRQDPPDMIHAVWATAPGAAAILLNRLTDIPFSMGAHAYDIHRNGGDCLLLQKVQAARFVHTSTDDARRSLIKKGVAPAKLRLIRRGLEKIERLNPSNRWPDKIHLLSVGRLIEKKGYSEQLDIYAKLLQTGIDFEARIIGGGPLMSKLGREIRRKGLTAHVSICGALPYEEVQKHYAGWADILMFTGKVARSGDRDGFPNVIGEAMAHGLVVLSTSVAGIPEAIQSDETGFLLPLDSPQAWADTIQNLKEDAGTRITIQNKAHQWVCENFEQQTNAAQIISEWRTASDWN